jgi:hypothetical protein
MDLSVKINKEDTKEELMIIMNVLIKEISERTEDL